MSHASQQVLIIPDIHVPYHDTKALAVLEKFMASQKWDVVVYLGDLLDFDMISSFNALNLRENETRRMMEDYITANETLDRHQAIVRKRNKKAKFIFLEGNHEYRVQRLIDYNPPLEGLIEVPGSLHMEKRGMKWVPNWSTGELYKVGHLYFSHGNYITKYHAAKMADTYGVNIAYGHVHDFQYHPKQIWGKNKSIMAQSLGFLADESKLKYMKAGPSNWMQGFGIAEVREDGDFSLHPIQMVNYKFSYGGKTYS